jgi:hypothetical protein
MNFYLSLTISEVNYFFYICVCFVSVLFMTKTVDINIRFLIYSLHWFDASIKSDIRLLYTLHYTTTGDWVRYYTIL